MNEARHSVLTADAPPGVTLRLKKSFKTETFPQPQEGGGEDQPILFDDGINSVYDVGRDGKVAWHVNPSTRPIVAKRAGRRAAGPPSPPRDDLDGTLADAPQPCPTYFEVGPESCPGLSFSDEKFTFPIGDGVDNESATLRFEFAQSDDWDLEV